MEGNMDRYANNGILPQPNPTNTNTMPRYDPNAILNPRGIQVAYRGQEQQMRQQQRPQAYGGQVQAPVSFQFDSPQPSYNSRPEPPRMQYPDDPGMASMLERMHGVIDRSQVQPPKRQKVYDDRNGGARSVGQMSNGFGVVGNYMREQREAGAREGGRSTVVNLDGESDEVIIIDAPDDEEVCYGRIQGASVRAHQVPKHKDGQRALSDNVWPAVKIILRRREEDRKTTIIHAVDSTRGIIGCVDVHTSLGLASVLDSKCRVRTVARINSRPKKFGDLPPGTETSSKYDLDLNLYGPKKYALQVGKFLSQKQIWLRPPQTVEAGVQYYNPQDIVRPSLQAQRAPGYSYSSGASNSRTTEDIRNEVLNMFDTLVKSENLAEMDPDPRILTELLKHQKQGLYFMTDKETAHAYTTDEKQKTSLWKLEMSAKGERLFRNIITDQVVQQEPPQVLGGILADMMGLGKTLSILSLVVQTLGDSAKFATLPPRPQQFPEQRQSKGKKAIPLCAPTRLVVNAKSTLLVAPLSTIANWEEQIKQHISPGTLKVHIYHGSSRCRDISKLIEYDVIITTYGSVASEFIARSKKKDGKYPLEEINWFRVVLDEAHMIRETSTQQSKAICRLSAQRRWAVTGTPVQNRLDDLGALMAFLRIKPFDEKSGFAQYVLAPFKNCDTEILPKLRLLVDSITLRRLKDRIDLPPRFDKLVKLRFNAEEQKIYDVFAKNAQDRVKVITGQREKTLGGKSYVHILQSILRLRLVCAHGRDLLNDEDLKVMSGLSKDLAIELDDDDENAGALSAKQAYDMFNLMKETNADVCIICSRKIGSSDTAEAEGDEIIGQMTSCYHVLCNGCSPKWSSDLRELASGRSAVDCPICQQSDNISLFPLRQEGVEDEEESKIKGKDGKRKEIKNYSGPHTKTKALINDLLASEMESELNSHDRPIKSVVFSGWTSHLDLIERALAANRLKFVRLDGRMSRPARSAAIEAFRTDASIHVIIVSIGAGGLGLNLTTANKIYVMEPQYNPQQEAQAVDRVHRLGQKRPVETVRYIMEDSFEEKMLELQEKKKILAQLSMDGDGKRMDKAEAAKKRLEDLRSLFK
ncbi:SNF2 family N-terminal domain-containing protein [Calycina marina]|uniref:SNF2 family N-terminal domain-containing protein n=1 Tax=Calycina marina TaxID=1763456 RepID=A0A9P7YY88_9HELO|nr:SNF2 family N-terminal domain-containing protein [Calycina marina]